MRNKSNSKQVAATAQASHAQFIRLCELNIPFYTVEYAVLHTRTKLHVLGFRSESTQNSGSSSNNNEKNGFRYICAAQPYVNYGK